MHLNLNLGLGTSGLLSRFPTDGSPTLILDFVPVADPVYGASLSLSFTGASYQTDTTDPKAPLTNLRVWN